MYISKIINEMSCSLELENSIYTNTDIKNLEYVFYSLANYEKVNYLEFQRDGFELCHS